MSQRETQLDGSLQQWRGVDQRTSPTLVQEGFFVMSRGVFFGLGDNAERIPGKQLAGRMPAAVFQIHQFGDSVLIQTFDQLWHTDVQGLLDFNVQFIPFPPPAPVLSGVSYFTLNVTMPAVLPLYTTSFTLQRSLNGTSWTTVIAGLAALQIYPDIGLTDATTYYYRLASVGPGGVIYGPSANTTTLARLPDAPLTPSYSNVLATSFELTVPALPAYGVTMDLQRSPSGVGSWTTEDTGLTGGELYAYVGETTGVPVYFRMIAYNTHGSTNGAVSSVTPASSADNIRITESGDLRITQLGDFRITNEPPLLEAEDGTSRITEDGTDRSTDA